MIRSRQYLGRSLAVLGGVVVGAVLLVWLMANREAPEREEATPLALPVRVIEARPLPFRLEARGHGISRPAETWQAVASVAGRVVERHPDLASGAMLGEGTLLVALDPSRYELAIAEAEAELVSLTAELAHLDTEADNARRLLSLEQEALALAEQELSRIERLAASGSVSSSRRDEQRRSTLSQRQAVASLENSLALMPTRREVLEAQRERVAARLAQARRDLEDTRILAPYDLRLDEVAVERYQYVTAGQRLLEADSLAAAEVEAHIPIAMMRRLLAGAVPLEPPPSALELSERLALAAIEAEVALVGAEGVGWTGRLVRIASGLDPATRTVRAVVRVEDPYQDVMPPDRPPLQRDMYTRVRLATPSREPLLAVPASAVHQGELTLVDDDNRLVRRQVSVAFEQADLAVIAAGLVPGERVVVDDLTTAIEGRRLSPRRDESLEARMAAQARGEAP